jgi:WD40 repeat protein
MSRLAGGRARGAGMAVAVAVMLGMLVAVPGRAGAAGSNSPCGAMRHALGSSGQPVGRLDARQPVLLVHGLNGAPGITWDGKGGIADLLQSDGQYFVARFDFSYQDKLNQQWVTDPRISGTTTQPGLLSDVIYCMAQQSQAAGGSGKVIVVTYSLGGLAAQQAISETVNGQKIADEVGGLVSIAVPWQAVDQAHLSLPASLLALYCNKIAPGLAANGLAFLASGDACLLLTSLGLGSPAVQQIMGTPGGSLSLPQIQGSFPIYAIAGNMIWTAQTFNQSWIHQGDDGVVTTGSATHPPLTAQYSGQLTSAIIPCPGTLHLPTSFPGSPWQFLHVVLPDCFHVNLSVSPQVARRVIPMLALWRANLARSQHPAPRSWQRLRTLTDPSTTGGIFAIALSPDGKMLATGHFNGNVYLWDVTTGKLVATLQRSTGLSPGGATDVGTLAFSPDGKTLAAGIGSGLIVLWDTATQQKVATLSDGYGLGGVTSVAFSPDGRTLATGDNDGHAVLWDVASGHRVATLNPAIGVVASVAYSPDGRTLATGGDAGTVLWDVATGHETGTVTSVSGNPAVLWVAFSPDSQLLATGGFGNTTLWQVAAKRPVITLNGADDSAAFSPDGRTLATGGAGAANLWAVATGRQITTLSGLEQNASVVVAFSKTRAILAAGGGNGVIVWSQGG